MHFFVLLMFSIIPVFLHVCSPHQPLSSCLNYRDSWNALLHPTQPWLVSVPPTPAGIRSQHISFPAQFPREAPSAQGRDPSISHWGPLDLKRVAQTQGKDKELIWCLPKRIFMQKTSQMFADERKKISIWAHLWTLLLWAAVSFPVLSLHLWDKPGALLYLITGEIQVISINQPYPGSLEDCSSFSPPLPCYTPKNYSRRSHL